MQFQAFKRYHFTADVWEVEYDLDGNPKSEKFIANVRVSIDTDDATTLRLDSEQPLRTRTILRNIKDREGNLIYPSHATNTGEAYFVQGEVPLFGAFGTLEGYTSTARKLISA